MYILINPINTNLLNFFGKIYAGRKFFFFFIKKLIERENSTYINLLGIIKKMNFPFFSARGVNLERSTYTNWTWEFPQSCVRCTVETGVEYMSEQKNARCANRRRLGIRNCVLGELCWVVLTGWFTCWCVYQDSSYQGRTRPSERELEGRVGGWIIQRSIPFFQSTQKNYFAIACTDCE